MFGGRKLVQRYLAQHLAIGAPWRACGPVIVDGVPRELPEMESIVGDVPKIPKKTDATHFGLSTHRDVSLPGHPAFFQGLIARAAWGDISGRGGQTCEVFVASKNAAPLRKFLKELPAARWLDPAESMEQYWEVMESFRFGMDDIAASIENVAALAPCRTSPGLSSS